MTTWLVDRSAYTRLGAGPDAQMWSDRIERGLVLISTVTALEIGYSARSGADLRTESARAPKALLVVEYLTPTIERRAVEVQTILADRGLHRGPSVPDLLVAATAELGGHTVLHLDKDFETIAAVTGQALERLSR